MQKSLRKVLLVITKSNWGGAQRYVYDVATSLPSDQFQVTVALGGEGPLKQKLLEKGVTVISVPSLVRDINIFSDIKVFFFLLQLFKKEQYDVVHLNSSKIGAVGALAACLTGVKNIIFTIHGWAFNEDRGLLSKSIIKAIYWLTLFLCHQAIAVSEAVRIQAKTFWNVYPKITVIHLGIAPMFFLDKKMARLAILKQASPKFNYSEVNTEDYWIGTIGELHPIKGQKYAVEAVEDKFFIIGEGEERKNLEQQIKQGGLEKRVFLAGSMLDASQYLSAFDVFVFSSLSEGLGYVLLEAGLAGLSVVATNVGGIPEVITSMKNGILIQPRDAQALKEALHTYKHYPNKAKDFALDLQKTIKQRFALSEMIDKTISLYNRNN